jgi:hypothetical protein
MTEDQADEVYRVLTMCPTISEIEDANKVRQLMNYDLNWSAGETAFGLIRDHKLEDDIAVEVVRLMFRHKLDEEEAIIIYSDMDYYDIDTYYDYEELLIISNFIDGDIEDAIFIKELMTITGMDAEDTKEVYDVSQSLAITIEQAETVVSLSDVLKEDYEVSNEVRIIFMKEKLDSYDEAYEVYKNQDVT